MLLTAAKGDNVMYRMLPILLVALAFVLLTSAPAVLAADDVTVEGKIVKAADGKLTITDKDGKEHTTTVAADAKITCDGKECKLEDLKKDIQVKLTCKKDGDKFTALKVEAKTK
jgi:biopolymer transport protein ExbD